MTVQIKLYYPHEVFKAGFQIFWYNTSPGVYLSVSACQFYKISIDTSNCSVKLYKLLRNIKRCTVLEVASFKTRYTSICVGVFGPTLNPLELNLSSVLRRG